MFGPISLMFSATVSGFSGKFTVKPFNKCHDTAVICSPTHGRGRKDTWLSVSWAGSIRSKFSAILIMFRCVSIAPLGSPVVPEV